VSVEESLEARPSGDNSVSDASRNLTAIATAASLAALPLESEREHASGAI
jgi:hypothetical protein